MTRQTLGLSVVALLLSGTAVPAWAQDSSAMTPASTAPLDNAQASATDSAPAESATTDIVVTAQKRSERLQEVPLAVSVISGAQLSAIPRPSLESVTAAVPALTFLKSGTTLNQSLFLRGVGTSTFSIAGEPSVSVVVDGVVYSRAGEAFGDLVDIDQLEVLRGPQGTLFGKNASAGVINIVSQQPTDTFGGYVESSYFSGDEYRERAALNVPFSATLRSRFTGFYGSYDGNIYNEAVGHKVDGYKHYGGRAQFTWEPSSSAKLAFIADYHHNNDDCCADIIGTGPLDATGAPLGLSSSPAFSVLPTPKGDKTRRINQNLVTSTKETGYGFSLQGDFQLGDQTVTTITAYRNWRNTEIRDGDWLPTAYEGFGQLHDFGPETSHTFSQEIRLTSPEHQLLSYVIGAYYSNAYSERIFSRLDQTCGTVSPAVLTPCSDPGAPTSTFPTGTTDYGSRFKNLALFGQGTLNISKRFRFIGGARFTADQLNVFALRTTALAGPGISTNFDQGVYDAAAAGLANPAAYSNGVPWRGKATHTNLSGKAALQYDVTGATTAYVSYTRGYKGPAFNVFFNLSYTGTNVIAPETSNAYEAGLKNTLFGGRLVLNLDAFYAKYHNFQANNPDLVAGVVVTRFTNAGDVSTRGAEADLIWTPIDDLSINGGVAYTDAHVDQFMVAPGAAAGSVIPAGTPLGFAPKWKGSLAANYRWRTGGPIDLFLGADGNYQSKQLSLFAPDAVQRSIGTIHAYGLVNLSAGIGDANDRYRLTLQVRNLFDESFPAAIVNGGPSGAYRYQITRDADRYWGVTGRINF
ncbi:TonB-dependent receptor [Sphingomonas koreensis]|nr:TonB-dependent receptor [Sphingomonas koreensis]